MKLNDYFSKIYCINMDKSVDRWKSCVEQFENFGLDVERFSGIEVNHSKNGLLPGEIGVMKTNYEIIKLSKELGLDNVLILEDDFLFVDDFNDKFDSYINQIPDNWDFLYFGGNHEQNLIKIDENVSKMTYSFALHTHAVKNTMYDKILNTLPNEKKPVDVYYAEMMSYSNAYVFRPHISFQREGFSNIQNRYVNYDFLLKK